MRIAIVGGGIAGCSAAYYLSKLDCEIDIYEKHERLGGRVFTHPIYKIDQGAEYFISNNSHILELIDALNEENLDCKIKIEDYISTRAVHNAKNGKSIIMTASKDGKLKKLIKMIKLVKYLGIQNFSSLTTLNQIPTDYGKKIQEFYDTIDSSPITELFDLAGRENENLLKLTLCQQLNAMGISDSIVNNFINPLISPIYMLDASRVNALHGLMMFAAKNNRIHHVEGGNYNIFNTFQEYFEKENKINIKNKQEVIGLTYGEKIQLEIRQREIKSYDFVFLAMPHEMIKKIQFKESTDSVHKYLKQIEPLQHHQVFHHLVKAVPTKPIQGLFTKGSDTIFTGSGQDIWEINQVEPGVYDVTSQKSYEETDFKMFFLEIDQIHSIHWTPSYPLYTPSNLINLPVSPYIENNLAIGTEFLISSLDSGVMIAKRIVQMVKQKSQLQQSVIQ